MSDRLTDVEVAAGGLSPVSLVIPCRPEHVALCRLVAGSLGARDGLDEEAVADLKVIVTEACNCFMAMAAGGSARDLACECLHGRSSGSQSEAGDCSLRLDFDSRPGEFVIGVFYPEKRELVSWLEGCDPASEAGLGLTILKALADEMVELDAGTEGTMLRLTKRV